MTKDIKSKRTFVGVLPLFLQIAKFGVVGVISFATDYGLFTLLHAVFDVYYLAASTISFALSILVNYWLSMKFVFKSSGRHTKMNEFIYFVVLNLIGLVLNQIILLACVAGLSMGSQWGKIVATIVVMVYNFISRKLLLERPKRKSFEEC